MRGPLSKHVPGGHQIFRRIYTRIGCEGRAPHFVVEYYPYSGLTHTIRLREDTAQVRISDTLRNASPAVLEAVAAVLLSRLYRRSPPVELVEVYRRFSQATSTLLRLRRLRQRRAPKLGHRPAGQHHDLTALFESINRRYFGGSLPRTHLGWSKRLWRRQLGCFDPALNQIILSAKLDGPDVPVFAVAYVLYHEMLHVKYPTRFGACRRTSHSAAFRKEERQFDHYERAQRFLATFR